LAQLRSESGSLPAESTHPPEKDAGPGGVSAASASGANVKLATAGDAAKLRESGKLDEALSVLRHILNVHPQDAAALAELGRVHRRQGNHAAALAAFEAAVAGNPSHPGLKAEMVGELRELGRLDEAASKAKQILEEKPDHIAALVELGRVRRRQGDRKAALAAFESAVAARPGHAGLKSEMAAELRELGRLDEAETVLRGVLKGHPQQVDGLVGLAQIARRRGNRAASLAMFEAAMAASPDHVGIRSQPTCVADEVCQSAGIPHDALTRTQVEIRGHAEPMTVRTERDPTVLASLLALTPIDTPSEASSET
jgi:tetratricopeptide (TPR) repeat protein